MKYLHRYAVDNTPIFVLSNSPSKPAGTFSIKQEDWRGRALGRFGTVIGQLEGLKFSKKDSPVEEEETPEIKAKKASIVADLDKIASDFETEGLTNLALAVDQISDFLDSTKE
jgi:hypothetical protein